MLSVEVPLNTMLADLDETLRSMLKGELERHGFEGIEIAFDAPTREWSGQLSAPAVNLFLYDMRESDDERQSAPTRRRVGDEFIESPPPLVMEVSYAITAWAQAVEDEHRMLSQVLSVQSAIRKTAPRVRTQTIRAQLIDAPPQAIVEMHRVGGLIADADGTPLK